MGLLLKALSQNSPQPADEEVAREVSLDDDPKKTIPRRINRPAPVMLEHLELPRAEHSVFAAAATESAKIALPMENIPADNASPVTIPVLRPIAKAPVQPAPAVDVPPVEAAPSVDSSTAPYAIEPSPTPQGNSDADVLAHRLEELNELIADEIAGFPATGIAVQAPHSSPALIARQLPASAPLVVQALQTVPAAIAPFETPTASTIISPPPVFTPPPSTAPPLPLQQPHAISQLQVRRQYQELCDHLLTRISLADRPTLLFVDAGRMAQDAAWLMPLAICLSNRRGSSQSTLNPAATFVVGTKSEKSFQRIPTSKTTPQILIVEAAGPACGISATLGLMARPGLGELLHGQAYWKAVVQPTAHANIHLLPHGMLPPEGAAGEKFAALWEDVRRQYDAILVAIGPLVADADSEASDWSVAAAAFLNVANAAILCLELTGTPQVVASSTKQLLDACGVNVLGCVIRNAAA